MDKKKLHSKPTKQIPVWEQITGEEIRAAEALLSSDFTDRLMDRLPRERVPLKHTAKPNRSSKKNLLVYYTAAASVTLLLMASGVFQALVDTGTKAAAVVSIESTKAQRLNLDWSSPVVSQAAGFLQNFETRNIGRDKIEKEK